MTLIQSVLSTIPYYVMVIQTALLPLGVCEKLERLMRQFLWESTDEKKKVHLVKWEQVIQPKRQGGLGIRSMHTLNIAFLSKLGFRMFHEIFGLRFLVGSGGYDVRDSRRISST